MPDTTRGVASIYGYSVGMQRRGALLGDGTMSWDGIILRTLLVSEVYCVRRMHGVVGDNASRGKPGSYQKQWWVRRCTDGV